MNILGPNQEDKLLCFFVCLFVFLFFWFFLQKYLTRGQKVRRTQTLSFSIIKESTRWVRSLIYLPICPSPFSLTLLPSLFNCLCFNQISQKPIETMVDCQYFDSNELAPSITIKTSGMKLNLKILKTFVTRKWKAHEGLHEWDTWN